MKVRDQTGFLAEVEGREGGGEDSRNNGSSRQVLIYIAPGSIESGERNTFILLYL